MRASALFWMFFGIVLRIAANIYRAMIGSLSKELDSKMVSVACLRKATLALVVEEKGYVPHRWLYRGTEASSVIMFERALAMHAVVMEPSLNLIQPLRTLSSAFMYKKLPAIQVLLVLGFLVLAIKGVEGAVPTPNSPNTSSASNTSNACNTSGWDISELLDGILALILAAMWGLRTYLLNQSYAYNWAPYWASLRNSAFYLSIASTVVAIVAILLGWCFPTWHTTMQNVVAVVVGALAVATAERRTQGPASARLKALQRMLQRPYYRDGRTGGYGYSDDRRRLFEERDKIPWKGTSFKEGGWDCTVVKIITSPTQWRYYVKPGPMNDHFYMGRFQVLEAAGSGHDPLAFAAAYASVTASYVLRPKLKRVLVGIATNIVRNSGLVKSSLRSWRPGALAQLLGIDQLQLPDINDLDNWPTHLQDTKSIVVLWAVCWLEHASKMEDIMDRIAKYLSDVHASGKPWEPDAIVSEMIDAAKNTWIGPQTSANGSV